MTRVIDLFLRLADHDEVFPQTECGLFARMKKFTHLDIRQKLRLGKPDSLKPVI